MSKKLVRVFVRVTPAGTPPRPQNVARNIVAADLIEAVTVAMKRAGVDGAVVEATAAQVISAVDE